MEPIKQLYMNTMIHPPQKVTTEYNNEEIKSSTTN